MMRSKSAAAVLLTGLFVVGFPALLAAATQTVRIPISLDYSFIRSIFVNQAYTEPGEKAVPLDLAGGCTRIELSKPEVGPEKSLLKLGSNITVRTGLPLAGTCMKMGEWTGYIEVLQKILFDPKTMRLGLQATDFQTFNPKRMRTAVDPTLLGLVKTYVTPLLGRVSIDVGAPVKGLQGLLPFFFSPQDRSRAGSWLSTLRVSPGQVRPDGVIFDVLMDVAVPPPQKEAPVETPAVVQSWEDWDAYSVAQIQALTRQPVTEGEKDSILESLLDGRYQFVRELAEGSLSRDLTVRQFTSTWQSSGPILRKYLSQPLAKSPADYLSFLATGDALVALQKVGPDLGLNVDREGLTKLVQLLRGTGVETDLRYSGAVSPNLQGFFGLTPQVSGPGPAFDAFEIDLPAGSRDDTGPGRNDSLLRFLLPFAYADETSGDIEEIKPWLMPEGDIAPYLERVRLALEQSSEEVSLRTQLDTKFKPLFRLLVLSTAWQESCWRQFVTAKGKVRPILSYNQTSSGLMQINARVWRGIYRPERLRWDTLYNIRAGSEVLSLYLRKYALRREESRNIDQDTLARAVYAMYNGGPGQLRKFLARKKNNSFYKTDQLFWQKYEFAKGNELGKVSICLTGR
jgi:hypothetical protein